MVHASYYYNIIMEWYLIVNNLGTSSLEIKDPTDSRGDDEFIRKQKSACAPSFRVPEVLRHVCRMHSLLRLSTKRAKAQCAVAECITR